MHIAKLLCAFISHRNNLGGEWLSYSCILASLKNLPNPFPLVFPFPWQCPRGWIHHMLTRQQPCSAAVLLLVAILIGMYWNSTVILTCIFLLAKGPQFTSVPETQVNQNGS